MDISMEQWNQKKMRMRCRIGFLFFLSVFLVSCLGWVLEKPTFALRGIMISPRSFAETNLLLDFEIQNPNRFDLALTSFEYRIYLNDEEIGNGRSEKEHVISSSSTTRIQLPVAAKFKDFGGILKTLMTGNNLPYRIEGKAGVKTAFGSVSFSFTKEGRINLKR
jgi:LEA14-like dessication related protein